jgi:glycosyltransferase involved in cell wall biosynthesis
MRLLCFTPEPWPTFRPDVDILLGRELPRCGIQVDLMTFLDPTVPWRPWQAGESVVMSPSSGRFAKHLSRATRLIGQLLKVNRHRHAAIQVRDMPVMASIALLVGTIKAIPVVYWMSYPISRGLMTLAVERRREGSWVSWLPTWWRGAIGEVALRYIVLRRAGMIIVQSDRMREELVARGVLPQRLVAVPMGVDLSAAMHLASSAPSVHSWPGRRVIGYLGTLDRPRRINVLLEMLVELKHTIPEAMLLLVGDTTDTAHRHGLGQRIRELGLTDDVVITGWLPTRDAWQLLRQSEVALSPVPRGDLLDCSSPTKVPEYLALGIPVVCNDNPDQQAIIEACGAGSCVPYTPHQFAAAVLHWMGVSDAERAKCRAAGRDHVRRCRDYPVIAQALAHAYRQRLGELGVAGTE